MSDPGGQQAAWHAVKAELADWPDARQSAHGIAAAALRAARPHIEEEIRAPYEVTLATIRASVERKLTSFTLTDHGRGYLHALHDVQAILDKHGAPPGEPVHYGEPG